MANWNQITTVYLKEGKKIAKYRINETEEINGTMLLHNEIYHQRLKVRSLGNSCKQFLRGKGRERFENDRK